MRCGSCLYAQIAVLALKGNANNYMYRARQISISFYAFLCIFVMYATEYFLHGNFYIVP